MVDHAKPEQAIKTEAQPAVLNEHNVGWVASGAKIRRSQNELLFRIMNSVRGEQASQILELALSLPMLLVLVVGLVDFGQSWNIKQRLANAAREGTRIAASAPSFEATSCGIPLASSPCSIQAAVDTVKLYMVNAGLDASCLTPASSSSSDSSTSTWAFTCGNGVTLSITRPYIFTVSGGTKVMGTQISLTYPYTWSLNQVIKLIGGSSISLPSTISTNSVMANLN